MNAPNLKSHRLITHSIYALLLLGFSPNASYATNTDLVGKRQEPEVLINDNPDGEGEHERARDWMFDTPDRWSINTWSPLGQSDRVDDVDQRIAIVQHLWDEHLTDSFAEFGILAQREGYIGQAVSWVEENFSSTAENPFMDWAYQQLAEAWTADSRWVVGRGAHQHMQDYRLAGLLSAEGLTAFWHRFPKFLDGVIKEEDTVWETAIEHYPLQPILSAEEFQQLQLTDPSLPPLPLTAIDDTLRRRDPSRPWISHDMVVHSDGTNMVSTTIEIPVSWNSTQAHPDETELLELVLSADKAEVTKLLDSARRGRGFRRTGATLSVAAQGINFRQLVNGDHQLSPTNAFYTYRSHRPVRRMLDLDYMAGPDMPLSGIARCPLNPHWAAPSKRWSIGKQHQIPRAEGF